MASKAQTITEIQTPDIPFGWVCSSCGSNFCLLTRARWCIHTKQERYGKAPSKDSPTVMVGDVLSPAESVPIAREGADIILDEEDVDAYTTANR